MMDFRQVVDTFRSKHVQAGQILRPSLLALLMKDLVAAGLYISKLDGKFYQELAGYIFSDASKDVQIDAVDALMLLGRMVPLAIPEVSKPQATPKKSHEAIIDGDVIRTDHLVDDMPSEDSEGDPLYTAPEDQIKLRPEDCAPIEYDEEFCARIGATRDRR